MHPLNHFVEVYIQKRRCYNHISRLRIGASLDKGDKKMRLVLSFLTLVVLSILAATVITFQRIPQAVGTAVIAEKPNKVVGGQVAYVLPSNLTKHQYKLLNMAYELGKVHGLKNPEIVQAVLLQETLAGGLSSYRVANPGPEAYFGPGQIKLAAAKDVLARWPELYKKYGFHTETDDEIRAHLILHDMFNIEVMTKYLVLLKTQYGFTGAKLLQAYNRGPGGVTDDHTYANNALSKLRNLQKVSLRE
jgi:hypothetical protein